MGPLRAWMGLFASSTAFIGSQQVGAVSTETEAELAEVVPEVTQVFLDPTPRDRHRADMGAASS